MREGRREAGVGVHTGSRGGLREFLAGLSAPVGVEQALPQCPAMGPCKTYSKVIIGT